MDERRKLHSKFETKVKMVFGIKEGGFPEKILHEVLKTSIL